VLIMEGRDGGRGSYTRPFDKPRMTFGKKNSFEGGVNTNRIAAAQEHTKIL
jgi:hypothetical protein